MSPGYGLEFVGESAILSASGFFCVLLLDFNDMEARLPGTRAIVEL